MKPRPTVERILTTNLACAVSNPPVSVNFREAFPDLLVSRKSRIVEKWLAIWLDGLMLSKLAIDGRYERVSSRALLSATSAPTNKSHSTAADCKSLEDYFNPVRQILQALLTSPKNIKISSVTIPRGPSSLAHIRNPTATMGRMMKKMPSPIIWD